MVKYNNPPIIEAACEFVFASDTEWDSAIPGLIYAEAKDLFPNREQRSRNVIIGSRQKASSLEDTEIKRKEYTVFLNKDKTMFIKVSDRGLSMNQLSPYSTWNEFKENIKYIFDIANKIIKFGSLQRIGLRYVNLINIPEKKIEIESYFELCPSIGERLPQDTVSFITGCVFPFSDERDACKVQLVTRAPKDENTMSYTLDIDYLLIKPRSILADQTLDWIENAHSEVEKIFEGCITDTLRKVFGEVK